MCDMDEEDWSPDPIVLADMEKYFRQADDEGEGIAFLGRTVSWPEFLEEIKTGSIEYVRKWYNDWAADFYANQLR